MPVPPLPMGSTPLTPEVREMRGNVAAPVPPLPTGRIPLTPEVRETGGRSAGTRLLNAGVPAPPVGPENTEF